MNLVQEFDRIKSETEGYPWMTEFLVDGKPYGGTNSYIEDPRVSDFLGWTPPHFLSNVLELGSCEGGQTFEISKCTYVRQIKGLEGKPWLVSRAQQTADLLNRPFKFERCDFDNSVDLAWLSAQRATSVFCSGVLYHLMEPWKLINSLVTVTNWLYLATHFILNPVIVTNGYHGYSLAEPPEVSSWTGLHEKGFWFTLPDLIKCLMDNGWSINLMRVWPQWSPTDFRPMVGVLCNRVV